MAGAASCLIVTGLAIPFAVSGVRVNPAVGGVQINSIIFWILYNDERTKLLGEAASPLSEVAAWAPNIFMVLLTYALVRRVR